MSDEELISRALDEIWHLRQALAYEATVLAVHTGYKTFPKSRRRFADEQVRRMRESAQGHAQLAYAGTSSTSLRSSMRDAGACETLTRGQFEDEIPRRFSFFAPVVSDTEPQP